MAEALTINRAQTAVLLMDYQNDIVSNVEASSPGLLDRAASVLSAARRAGVPVIY
jgi:nicotinamidase-related amidase